MDWSTIISFKASILTQLLDLLQNVELIGGVQVGEFILIVEQGE